MAWEGATANVCDNKFQPLIKEFEDEMIILSDEAFHSRNGDPKNLKLCNRGTWNVRMIIKTTFSMLTLICDFNTMMLRF